MTRIHQIVLTELMLSYDTDIEIIHTISRQLGRLAIKETEMVVCGIEGKGLETVATVSELPDRQSTYGSKWKDLVTEAKRYDNSLADNFAYPIYHARATESIAALIMYDSNLLVESKKDIDVWLPRDHFSLSSAAKALVFFRN